MAYVVYILTCADSTLYTGIATDINRRVHEHNESDKGAKYTRARRPVTLSYTEELPSRSEAAKREAAIKRMSRKDKLTLIRG